MQLNRCAWHFKMLMVYIIVQCNELSFQEIQVDFIFVCLSVHYHRIPGWKGTSGILWYKFSWQKHNPDKMAQHPVQLNLGNVLHWGIHHFPGKIIPKDRCLIMKIFLFFLSNRNHSRRNLYLWLLGKREPSSLL